MKTITKYRVAGIILLLIIGLNAIYAGAALILHPDGSAIGLPVEILRLSPFSNFLIPGIVLLLVNGVANIIVAVLTWNKNKYYARLITIQGIVLLLWLITQIIFLREINTLHFIMFGTAIILMIIGESINERNK